MTQIFISYSQKDRERVRELAAVLESLGYSVWWDIKIPPGKVFSQVIGDALKQTLCVIVLWSRHSVTSEWIEIEAARGKQRKILVPALLDDVASDIPLEFSRLHAADLTGWRPDVQSQEWDVFLRAVREHVGAEPERRVPDIRPPSPAVQARTETVVPAPAPAATVQRPAVAQPASFDDDLQRVVEWHDMDDDGRAPAVEDYLHALNISGLDSLRTNIEQMQANCATNIHDHRENEARIAGGRFIEDQMSYRMAVLRTGQHDPDWSLHLQGLEAWARWFAAVHTTVSQQIETVRRRAAPADLSALGELKHLLEARLASGEVRGERATVFRRTLKKIEALFAAKERGDIQADELMLRFQQLARDIAPMFDDPG